MLEREEINRVLGLFETAWRAGNRPRIEDVLMPVQDGRLELTRKLIELEVTLRLHGLEVVDVDEYRSRFRECDESLWKALVDLIDAEQGKSADLSTMALRSAAETDRVQQGISLRDAPPPVLDRYRILKVLGRGAFGTVYLAEDDGLQRQVAIKIPHAHISDSEDYLQEPRILAGFDHPGIVPIYDVSRCPDGRHMVISKYIAGKSLRGAIDSESFTFSQTARLLALVAEALNYAHSKKVFHRDIKPGNILLTKERTPCVVDFGMALRASDVGGLDGVSGTPRYMSPEQARGHSSLVDGRSDIFSLGVVLYEMLTGEVPFAGDVDAILWKIVNQEARPPRSLDERIPRDLEVICLKALSKQMANRYSTAGDLAQALWSCVTYTPEPIDIAGVHWPGELQDLFEELAENNHEVWAQQRIADGWEYGDVRDDVKKTHPDLVPYEQLTEAEKEYDRLTVTYTLKAIMSLGYRIERR